MTNDAFTIFFYDVVPKQIPTEVRHAIQAYWDAFHVEPRLVLGDAEINAEFGVATDIAAVGGRGCLHRFAFREFVVEHAPENIAQTIIQHELVHCYLDRSNTPAKLFAERLLHPPPFNRPMDFIAQAIAKAQEAVRQVASYHFEEQLTAAINATWGCNDEEAGQWIQEYRIAN